MSTSTPELGDTDRLLNLLSPRRRRLRPDPDGRPPNDAELATLIHAASSVPDHGGLQPWRFVIAGGDARRSVGDALAADLAASRPDAPPALMARTQQKAFAAPMMIILVASSKPGSKVPEWEQTASAACCGYAIVLAASALGLGAVWKSTTLRGGIALRQLCELDNAEQILGWINVGSPEGREAAQAKAVVDIAKLVTVLA